MGRTLKFFEIISGRGLAIALLMAAPFSPAAAAEVSCDQLVEILSQTGENPVIAINFAKETVTIKTTRGFCTESIDAWSNRPAVSTKAGKKPAVPSKPEPALKPEPKPEQKPKQVTVPSQGKKYTPPPAPKEIAPPADTVPPPAPKEVTPVQVPVLERPPVAPSCRYQVGDVWGSMTVKIEGIDHWLVRAFTMDLDGDRVIDNVNFKFQAKNKSTRELQYFGVAGEISGNAYPALKLRDESVIQGLCFGQQKYKRPDFFGDKKERVLFDVHKPDLAGEKDARDRGIAYVRPSTKKQKTKEKETSWWVWLAGSLGVLLLGGGGFWFYRQRAKAKDGDKAGDEEEDEPGDKMDDDGDDEDDEDKPEKKKGLAGLLSRFKGKKKKKSPDANDEEDEDDDEDDDEDGEGRSEKKKKGMGGFFSRFKGKKKKKTADEEDAAGDDADKKG